jgi:AcrR family transcriptional regulator
MEPTMPRLAGRNLLILKAAASFFARKGYEATTVAEVAKAADSNIGSLMHFFPTKSHLALAVRDSVAKEVASAVGAALERHPRDVAKAIEGAIAAYLAWVAGNPEKMMILRELSNVRLAGERANEAFLVEVSDVLEIWATPLFKLRLLPPTDSTHLIALILAPAVILSWSCCLEDLERLGDPKLAQAMASQVLNGLLGRAKSKGRSSAAGSPANPSQLPSQPETTAAHSRGQLDLGLQAP